METTTYESSIFPITSITSGHSFTSQLIYIVLSVNLSTFALQDLYRITGFSLIRDYLVPLMTYLMKPKSVMGEIPPKAIILTYGHFDHVGSVLELVNKWDVPVYAHKLELPYLTGESNYPPPDPSVKGGLISSLSRFFPNKTIQLGKFVKELPIDGSVPGMPDWRWIHTPGHTPGHISLFRKKDIALVARDAFITVKQESLFKVMTQVQEIHGPPAYFTMDWHTVWGFC